MLYFFRLLLLLVHIDQEMVLNWFGVPSSNKQNYLSQQVKGDYINTLSDLDLEPSKTVSLDTLKLLVEGLWEKIQDGLTLADIENIVFFILFVRFVILAVKYNLKTSLYITCIGLFAGYLWYRHLIDLISMYRNVLLKLPFLHKLGMDAIQLRSLHKQMVVTDLKLGENVSWNNPAQLVYYAITKGITDVDPSTGLSYYIDPISMTVSNLDESTRSNVLPFYYKVYNRVIPKIFEICSKFWNQLSGIAAYVLVTRIGKRYCPYLVRWHWTFLLIIALVEQTFVYLIYRIYYFQMFVLIPQTKIYGEYVNSNLTLQIGMLNGVIAAIVLAHLGFVIFGLLHAICGQYFYFPFFVENTELHIGPRPRNSVYSGGKTSWQDPIEKEKGFNRVLPKFWYGWFGRGTGDGWKISQRLKKVFKNILKIFKRRLRR